MEKIKEPSTSTRSEEAAQDDTIIFPPSDDDGEDVVCDDISNEFVDVGQEQVDFDQGQPTNVRRSAREPVPSTRYPSSEYVTITECGEPENFSEVKTHVEKEKWLKAIQDEMKSLHDNHTYELVDLPKGKRALKNKWVYRIKHEENNTQPRYKARLGLRQKKGIDFDEIFSPFVKMSSIRIILTLAVSLDLDVEQLDVKTTFLHGDLEETIYMEQPEGFKVRGKEQVVCRLKKSLYSLKQAPK